MAAAGPSPSAPSRPGAGVAMTAAGWRDCGDGAVVGLSAATAVGLSTAPVTGDGVAISGRPASRSGRGDRRWARLTPAPLGRRRVAGDGHLRCGFVGDDGIGSVVAPPASSALGGARSSTGCRVDLAGGNRPAVVFAGDRDGASISLPPVPPDPVLPFFSGCSFGAHRRCGARSPLLRCSSLLRLGCFQSMPGAPWFGRGDVWSWFPASCLAGRRPRRRFAIARFLRVRWSLVELQCD
uniref:Uncharacterized protein n=1 Tax=Oryza nivara TaxID=4536 RepID=A0A0E0G708_ORYNI